MPQVWVSYDELGQHFDCSSSVASARAKLYSWPRRKCSDGVTRVKLPLDIMHDYIRAHSQPEVEKIVAISSWTLQSVADQMRGLPEAQARMDG